MPLAIPLAEADLVNRALALTGESRNEFVRVAAVNRARQVLAEATSSESRIAVRRSVDRLDPESATA